MTCRHEGLDERFEVVRGHTGTTVEEDDGRSGCLRVGGGPGELPPQGARGAGEVPMVPGDVFLTSRNRRKWGHGEVPSDECSEGGIPEGTDDRGTRAAHLARYVPFTETGVYRMTGRL
ncbi:hypothetical protein GCM10009755_02930 [Brevibacterium samyangense]|uniref:Uncharacterized protein n=1 Tax=Brevibacterium samyangense TaxID=366888 RepID=A0ABN2T530_9MICO